jgi:hypothetical protein
MIHELFKKKGGLKLKIEILEGPKFKENFRGTKNEIVSLK